jgi:hypothetical protein
MHLGTKLAAILMGSMLAAAAGCADGADVTAPRVASEAPAYDGSGWAGNGNRTKADATTTETGNGSGWAGSGNLTAADSATGARGSGWAGSGN